MTREEAENIVQLLDRVTVVLREPANRGEETRQPGTRVYLRADEVRREVFALRNRIAEEFNL